MTILWFFSCKLENYSNKIIKPATIKNIEAVFLIIAFFEIFSLMILGKKQVINKVNKNKKIYCNPLSEFKSGKNPTGVKKIAKLCKTLAPAPHACVAKNNFPKDFFSSKFLFFFNISCLFFFIKIKLTEIKNKNMLLNIIPCQKEKYSKIYFDIT